MQRLALSVHCRVFIKTEDNAVAVKEAFLALFPFPLVEEKVALDETKTEDLDASITILHVALLRPRHVNAFLKRFNTNLSAQDRAMIIAQKESRLDDEGMFYVRLEKQAWLAGVAKVTDSGECFHCTFEIAAFPRNRNVMLANVEKLFAVNQHN